MHDCPGQGSVGKHLTGPADHRAVHLPISPGMEGSCLGAGLHVARERAAVLFSPSMVA